MLLNQLCTADGKWVDRQYSQGDEQHEPAAHKKKTRDDIQSVPAALVGADCSESAAHAALSAPATAPERKAVLGCLIAAVAPPGSGNESCTGLSCV